MPNSYSILSKLAIIFIGLFTFRYTIDYYLSQTDKIHEKEYDKPDLIFKNFFGHQKFTRKRVDKIELFDFVIGGVKKCGTAALTTGVARKGTLPRKTDNISILRILRNYFFYTLIFVLVEVYFL